MRIQPQDSVGEAFVIGMLELPTTPMSIDGPIKQTWKNPSYDKFGKLSDVLLNWKVMNGVLCSTILLNVNESYIMFCTARKRLAAGIKFNLTYKPL